jgi:RsiW-degrading membrane proteinase PrsW (M82 family)
MTRSRPWTPRQMLCATGLVLWFGSTFIQTGIGTIVALWTAALFVGGLLVVTLPVRTLTLAELFQPFCLGGAMIGAAVLAGWAFDLAFGAQESALRALGMPAVEETLKIAPLFWVLWRIGDRRWTLGATDVLLLAAVAGAGFYWVEEAYIVHSQGSWAFFGAFPTTEVISDRHGSFVIAGHAIWSGIAGLGIGIALLLRGSHVRMLAIAASGWAWSVFDHGANNYNVNYRDAFSRAFQIVTGNGYLSLYLFVLGVFAAVALDFYFANLALPVLSEVKRPPLPTSWAGLRRTWSYLRLRRGFGFAVARHERDSSATKAHLAVLAAGLDAVLHNWHVTAATRSQS